MTINYYGGGYPGLSTAWLALIFVGISCLYFAVIHLSFHLSGKLSLLSSSLSATWLLLPLLGALLLGGTLLFLPVVFSPDMQFYLAASQAGARYYANPPAALLSASSPVLYGPSWLAIVTLLVNISSHSLFLLTLLLRGIQLLSHLANTCLIWAILARIAPTQRLPGTLLYAWNPLVLLELAGNGYDGGLVICLLLLALWLTMRSPSIVTGQPNLETSEQRPPIRPSAPAPTDISAVRAEDTGRDESRPYDIAAVVLIGLAIGMDWLAFVVAPLVLLFMARQRSGGNWPIRGPGWRALLMIVVVVLIYLPVWQGSATFVAIISSIHLQTILHSLPALLYALLNPFYTGAFNALHITAPSFAPVNPSSAASITIITSMLFVFLLLYIRELGRGRKYETFFTGLCIVIAAYTVLTSMIFWPWYLVWITWIVALRPLDLISKTMLVFSCSALLYYPLLSLDGTSLAFLVPLCIFGIPFVYLIGAKAWVQINVLSHKK